MWGLQDTTLLWAGDRENALFLADIISIARGKKDFFVIGGGEIFERFAGLFNKVYLTEVLGDNIEGDAKFDSEFKYPYWRTIQSQNFPKTDFDDYPSTFSIMEKRDKTTRFRIFPEYLTDAGSRRRWIKDNLRGLTAENPKAAAQEAQQLHFETIKVEPR